MGIVKNTLFYVKITQYILTPEVLEMTSVLIKLFVRDHRNTADPRVRERYGTFAGIMGIVSNLVLFAIKIAVGTLFNSIAVTADAVNNLSDSGSSLITLLGFKLSGKPADAQHPYGHARIEYISGLIVSFIVVILGVQLIQSSIAKILRPEMPQVNPVFIGALAVSILLKLWQSLFYRRIGRTINSVSLAATSVDSRNDVISTAAVLAAAVITLVTGVNLDGYMGAAVALFILVSGIKLIIETSSPLLGVAPDKEVVAQIYNKILSYEGILGLHDLAVHSYGGGNTFATVHCEMSAHQDIMISHDIIDNVERDFKDDLGIELVIHLDPIDVDDEKTNQLREKVTQLIDSISPQIGIHDFRVVWGITHSNLIFDVEVPFGFHIRDEELVKKISGSIRQLDPAFNTVITVDHDYIPRTAVTAK